MIKKKGVGGKGKGTLYKKIEGIRAL